MKRTILIILGIFILLLTACSEGLNLDRLSKPIGLSVEKNVFSFQAVDQAEFYLLNVNGQNIEITETSYVFETEGTYGVRVRAMAENYLPSLFSDEVTVVVGYLDYPSIEALHFTNNILHIDQDARVDGYLVEINGILYDTRTAFIPYFVPGTYMIRIKAVSDLYIDSAYSPTYMIEIDEYSRLYLDHQYSYSMISEEDLLLYEYMRGEVEQMSLLYQAGLDDEEKPIYEAIADEYMYRHHNGVYLKREALDIYFELLTEEIENDRVMREQNDNFDPPFVYKYLVLQTNLGEHTIRLKFMMVDDPYVLSDVVVETNFYDSAIFRFDTFGYAFVGLSGAGIMEDDYSFENGVLTISIDFITNYFETNTQSGRIILTYSFIKKGGAMSDDGTPVDALKVGFISINR